MSGILTPTIRRGQRRGSENRARRAVEMTNVTFGQGLPNSMPRADSFAVRVGHGVSSPRWLADYISEYGVGTSTNLSMRLTVP
jgi:hypothetical protein